MACTSFLDYPLDLLLNFGWEWPPFRSNILINWYNICTLHSPSNLFLFNSVNTLKSVFLFLLSFLHSQDGVSDHPRPAYKRPRWWFGFSLYLINIIFNFASYMFASLNILAPTSALVIIINAILARIYFNERLSLFGYLGSALIMIGCVLCILFGTHDQDELDISNLYDNASTLKFIVFTSVHGFLCVVFGIIGATKLAESTSNLIDKIAIGPDPELLCGLNSAANDKPQEVFHRQKHPVIDDGSGQMKDDDNDGHQEEDEETPVEDQQDNTPLIRASTPDETSAIIPKTRKQQEAMERDEWKHIIRCFLIAFTTAGVVAWVQFFGVFYSLTF